MEADAGSDRHLNGAREHDVGMAKHRVNAKPPGFVAGNLICDLVGGPSVVGGTIRIRSAGEARLIGRVVGNLRLIEVGAPGVSVPQHLELLVMFDEEAIDGDVIAIDDEAVGAGIRIPTNAGTVIGAPDLGVIDDCIVAIDSEVDSGAADTCSTYPKEDVVNQDGVSSMTRFAAAGPYLKQHRRTYLAGIE